MASHILIVGGGESGVGAAILAKKLGAEPFLSDGGTLHERYRALLVAHEIPFEEGGHSSERVAWADLVIKSPGIPEKAAIVQAIRAANIPLVSEIEYGYQGLVQRCAAENRPLPVVVAITGSNGKTTTTSLVHHLLQAAGVDACLGGNIGISFALAVAQEPIHAAYVLEISSFQLDDVRTFAPDVAVLTNITPDHLDRYKYELKYYAAAKFNIQQAMNGAQTFIYNADDPHTQEFFPEKIAANALRFSTNGAAEAVTAADIPFDFGKMQLVGKHNLQNALAAALAVREVLARLNHTAENWVDELYTFQPIEHRLEPVATIGGVRYLNDSKATNVDSVLYALGGVPAPIVWIAGGVDKGNDYTPLLPDVRQKVKALIVLGGGKEALHAVFEGIIPIIIDAASLAEALHAAQSVAVAGDTVLLSPACASFDLFQNYEDRGRKFKAAVLALT